jgi:predicted GNAT family N-acyltransferase
MQLVSVLPFEGKHYVALLLLRQAVLRTPLHQTLTISDLEAEQDQHHVALVDGDRVLGGFLLKLLPDAAQLRQMVIDPAYQGAGLGTRLMHHAEQLTQALGHHKLVMQARLSASPFYQKLGYQRNGNPYKHLGIDHVDMVKSVG